MLNKATQEKLSEVLDIPIADLETALTSDEETSLEVPALYKETDLETIKANRFDEGKKAATEILVKDLKVKHEINFNGKTVDGFLTAYADKVKLDASIDPDKKVTDLEADKMALQGKITELTNELDDTKITNTAKLARVNTENRIFQLLPDGLPLSKTDAGDILSRMIEVSKDDGIETVKVDGVTQKDTLLNPIPLSEVVPTLIDLKKWIDTGVNGDGDKRSKSKGTDIVSTNDFLAYCSQNGIESMGPEGQELLREARKNPNFKS